MSNITKDVCGVSFTCIPIVPFEEWINQYKGGMAKFMELSTADREKIFLRWKWGFMDERANEQLESNERGILFQFRDTNLSLLPAGTRFSIENRVAFDHVCFTVKRRIGLVEIKNDLVEKLKDTFDAQRV